MRFGDILTVKKQFPICVGYDSRPQYRTIEVGETVYLKMSVLSTSSSTAETAYTAELSHKLRLDEGTAAPPKS